MKAMLLAAGLGTRLQPMTHRIPKPLIPVDGLPLIFYNLALLRKFGIKKVVINLHHLGDQIKKLLGSGKEFGFDFQYSRETKIMGTGGGIKKAERLLKNGDFLVMNADIIIDINLKRLLAFHKKKRPYATLVVAKGKEAKKHGILYVDRNKNIVSILKKPENQKNLQETFFTGIHVLNPRFFQNQKARVKACIVQDNYIPRLGQGDIIGAYINSGYWSDLGTPSRLKKTNSDLKQGRIRLSYGNHLEFFRKILDQKKGARR